MYWASASAGDVRSMQCPEWLTRRFSQGITPPSFLRLASFFPRMSGAYLNHVWIVCQRHKFFSTGQTVILKQADWQAIYPARKPHS